MDESRAKYCEVASLKRVLWESREGVVFVVEDEDEESSDLAFVRAWIARPAELISFVTSCSNQPVSTWFIFCI